jgi:hypothetical protein
MRLWKVAKDFQPPANLTCVHDGDEKEILILTGHAFVDDSVRRITDFRNLSPCPCTNEEGSACGKRMSI